MPLLVQILQTSKVQILYPLGMDQGQMPVGFLGGRDIEASDLLAHNPNANPNLIILGPMPLSLAIIRSN